jgi:TolB-like protein
MIGAPEDHQRQRMSLFDELKRRNVIKVAMLYVVASWLILQVADVLFEAMELPATGLRMVLAILILGFPLALIFSWVFEMTPEGLKRERNIDRSVSVTAHTGKKINILIVVLLILAIGAVVVDRLIPEAPAPAEPVVESSEPEATADPSVLAAEKFAPPPDRSIAVLPFVNMSGDEENEYFADGLSEEILNFLAGVPDLQVTARTSSFQFKGKTADMRDVGSALNVAHLLEGSVRRSGERARITAQLIRTSDGYHLWSESYDRTLEDVFEVQTDIAESVTRALGVIMDDAQRQRMLAAGIRDVEAFIAFQKGHALYIDAHTKGIDIEMMSRAADWFSEAIRREPRFASAYFLRSDFHVHTTTTERVSDEDRQAAYKAYMGDLAAASEYTPSADERALIEVDRTMASNNWGSLPERFELALEGRGCDEAVWLEIAPAFGFAEQSVAFRRSLIECDPLNFYNYHSAVQAYLWAGRPEEALSFALRGLEVEPDNAFLEGDVVISLIALGRPEEAREHAENVDNWNRNFLLVSTSVALDDIEGAKARIEQTLGEAPPWLRRYLAIQLHAITGDREAANEAAAWFDRIPAGNMMLAATTMECMCGAPFDLEATPNFRQRLQEAGFDWPPPAIIDRDR